MTILPGNDTLGVIGGGNMPQSCLIPLFKKGLINPKSVIISAKTQATLDFWGQYGCRTTLKNEEILEKANIVIWAIKPQVWPVVIEGITKQLNRSFLKAETHESLHISIMAGISLDQFRFQVNQAVTGPSAESIYSFRAIRVMPNIALQVSSGVTVCACGPDATEADKSFIKSMFQPMGLCYEAQEHQLNAYCGLVGSGIGFMFPIMEALSDGAVKMGIPRAVSLEIAAQVMKGAGELYLHNKMHPGALKDMVCSPGGTTIAGIAELEKGQIRSTIISAVEAATLRGEELGKSSAATSTPR